jgi:hypothetical protein
MKISWDDESALTEKSKQNEIFVILLNDEDKIIGAFCGEPSAMEVVWNNGRYEAYEKENINHKGKKIGLRIFLNVYIKEENKMKVMEGGTKWFKTISRARDKYGLDKWLFEIQRHGKAGDPDTTYSILPEEKISDDLKEEINSHKLHNLEEIINEKYKIVYER